MSTVPELKELMKAGLHFGHRPTAWNPKMKGYIFGTKNTVHIFNLEKTKQALIKATDFIKKISSEQGTILFVGTKPQAKEIIKKYALECDMPYVTERWLGGTLTNFKVINGLVKKLEKLISQSQDENYEKKYTKKERLEFTQEKKKLEVSVGGISQMTKLPSAIFISSVRGETTAVREAIRRKIPIIGVCDTNTSPEGIDYVIPANDDAVKSIELITSLIAKAIIEGEKAIEKNTDKINDKDIKKQDTENNTKKKNI